MATLTADKIENFQPTATFGCPYCAFRNRPGRGIEPRPEPCRYCGSPLGENGYVTLDLAAILGAIVATRGENKGKLRASAPDDTVFGARTVWRLIRFHIGADMSLPVMSFDYVGVVGIVNGPAEEVIDWCNIASEALAVGLFGARRALTATAAWGRVLTGTTLPGFEHVGMLGDGYDVRPPTGFEDAL